MRHIKFISILLVFLPYLNSFGQRSYETNPDSKRANIWYFGQNAGINFNTNPPTVLTDGKVKNNEEGGGVMCDTNGNILFYTDGRTVWNKNHDTMENGFGLLGGNSASQTGLCLKHPDNDSLYYVFNTPYSYDYSNGLSYSIININFNNGLGKLVSKNIKLNSNCSEKICATYHANGKDIWIIGHEYGNNRFFKYLLKKDGVVNCPKVQDTGVIYTYVPPFVTDPLINQGFIKSSSNNKYILHSFTPEGVQIQYRRFELYYFNSSNADFTLLKNVTFDKLGWGVEFSPNSENLIYFDRDSFSFIYNIKKNIKRKLGLKFGQFETLNLQMAPDGNIYYGKLDSTYVNIIKNSNNFDSVKIINKYINLLSKKYKYVVPNIFNSYLNTPSINFFYSHNCINNSVNFTGLDTIGAIIYKWIIFKSSITNPLTTATSKKYTYTFSDTGIFNICFIANSDSLIKTIKITPKINKNFLGNDTIFNQGVEINSILKAPNSYCYFWQDSSGLSTYNADTTGVFYCKILTHSYCSLVDTISIQYCKDSLQSPTLNRINDSLYIQNSINADSFKWYRNNAIYKKSNINYLKLTDTGAYRVEAIKYGYCNKSSANFNINKLGTNNVSLKDFNIKIFPNPSSGNITIENNSNIIARFNISNIIGDVLYQNSVQEFNNNYDLILKQGIYIITLEINNQTIKHKLIIQ